VRRRDDERGCGEGDSEKGEMVRGEPTDDKTTREGKTERWWDGRKW